MIKSQIRSKLTSLLKIVSVIFLFSCRSGVVENFDQMHLSGTIEDMKNAKVYLSVLEFATGVYKKVDSTYSQDGKFEFCQVVSDPSLAILEVASNFGMKVFGTFWIENSRFNIILNCKKGSLSVHGSPLNSVAKKYYQYWGLLNIRGSRSDFSIVDSSNFKRIHNVISKNKSSFYSLYGIYQIRDVLSFEQLRELMSLLTINLTDYTLGNMLLKYKSNLTFTQVGNVFPKLKLISTTNEKVLLDSFRSRINVIQIWASWCIPCQEERLKLEKMVTKYGNTNFGVINISIDSDFLLWKRRVTELNSLMTDLITDTIGIQKLAVTYIPTNYLISPEGVIIEKNISENRIDELLREL